MLVEWLVLRSILAASAYLQRFWLLSSRRLLFGTLMAGAVRA
jgi:hypothetical protein